MIVGLCLVLAGKEMEVPTLLESYNYRQLLLSKILLATVVSNLGARI
jgi:hypothetical protein